MSSSLSLEDNAFVETHAGTSSHYLTLQRRSEHVGRLRCQDESGRKISQRHQCHLCLCCYYCFRIKLVLLASCTYQQMGQSALPATTKSCDQNNVSIEIMLPPCYFHNPCYLCNLAARGLRTGSIVRGQHSRSPQEFYFARSTYTHRGLQLRGTFLNACTQILNSHHRHRRHRPVSDSRHRMHYL